MKKTKAPRRTQEDRSALTRARLYEATVNSLYTRGYAATTTMVVCDDAGLSRGALIHQFPSRIDLLLYVVKAAYEEEVKLYREALEPMTDREERLLAFPRLVWKILSRPAGIAVLEIMQGSRSDPTLSARLKPLQKDIEQDSFKQVETLLGSSDRAATAAATRLLVWTIRGLSVARVLTDEPRDIEKSVELFERMLVAAMDAGVISNPKKRRAPPRGRKKT